MTRNPSRIPACHSAVKNGSSYAAPVNDPSMEVLIALHRGLDRLGPGDDAFSHAVLDGLGGLPSAACFRRWPGTTSW